MGLLSMWEKLLCSMQLRVRSVPHRTYTVVNRFLIAFYELNGIKGLQEINWRVSGHAQHSQRSQGPIWRVQTF